jgi:hypothetical protein
MAQPQKKELQITPVGHAMIGDTLGTPILQCDLLEEIQNLHKEGKRSFLTVLSQGMAAARLVG